MGYEQMADREPFCFLAAPVPGQSHQWRQDHWQRAAAHQQQSDHRFKDGGQQLAAEQNLPRSAVPTPKDQTRWPHRDQGHGRQARPFGLPHAPLRDEIRGPRSAVLPSSTPPTTNQAPQVESQQAWIPRCRSSCCLTHRSFWGGCGDEASQRTVAVTYAAYWSYRSATCEEPRGTDLGLVGSLLQD